MWATLPDSNKYDTIANCAVAMKWLQLERCPPMLFISSSWLWYSPRQRWPKMTYTVPRFHPAICRGQSTSSKLLLCDHIRPHVDQPHFAYFRHHITLRIARRHPVIYRFLHDLTRFRLSATLSAGPSFSLLSIRPIRFRLVPLNVGTFLEFTTDGRLPTTPSTCH